MRVKRAVKFRKFRNKRIRNFVLYGVVLPCTSVFVGYLITTILILPSIIK